MPTPAAKSRCRKVAASAPAVLCIITLLTLSAGPMGADEGGCPLPTGHTGAEGHCRDCHTPPDTAPDGSLTITGVPEMFEPRHQYTVIVAIGRGSGPWPYYGYAYAFQLAVTGGSLQVVDSGTTMEKGPLEVQSRGVVEATEWTLVWTAPETDEDVDFFCEAVVGDGDGTVAGDIPYRATAKAYGPLDVAPEDGAGPYEGAVAIVGIVVAIFLVVGYLIIRVKERGPTEIVDEEE